MAKTDQNPQQNPQQSRQQDAAPAPVAPAAQADTAGRRSRAEEEAGPIHLDRDFIYQGVIIPRGSHKPADVYGLLRASHSEEATWQALKEIREKSDRLRGVDAGAGRNKADLSTTAVTPQTRGTDADTTQAAPPGATDPASGGETRQATGAANAGGPAPMNSPDVK